MTEFFISDTHFSAFNVAFRQNSNRLIRAKLIKNSNNINPDKIKENYDLIDQLDHIMITNWNTIVNKNDTVYFLGDLAMLINYDQWSSWLSKLNGKKIFIVGNHDQSRAIKHALNYPNTNIVEVITTAKIIKRNKQKLWLSHYPTLLSTGMINIHGHIHARTIESMLVKPEDGGDVEPHKFFNVGVDSNDMSFLPIGMPISLEQLLERIKN